MLRLIAQAVRDYRDESAELAAQYDRRDRAIIADMLRETQDANLEGQS